MGFFVSACDFLQNTLTAAGDCSPLTVFGYSVPTIKGFFVGGLPPVCYSREGCTPEPIRFIQVLLDNVYIFGLVGFITRNETKQTAPESELK